MADLTQVNEYTPFTPGMLVTQPDIAGIIANIDNAVGRLVAAMGGPNFLPSPSGGALTITPTGGFALSIGAAGQYVIAQGRLLDSCPATPLALASAGATDRLDLIALKSTRVNGTQSVVRSVRADGAATPLQAVHGTLVAGTVTIALPANYPTLPSCVVTPQGPGTGSLSTVVNATQVVVTSSDPNDARAVTLLIFGAPTGVSGQATTLGLQENQPAYVVVTGTNTATPPAPAGYEAFASIYVHANKSAIALGDITYLFPQLPALSMSLVLQALNVAGNGSFGGGVNVVGKTLLATLVAAATTLNSLIVTGDAAINGSLNTTGSGAFGNGLGVNGKTLLADLAAAAVALNSLTVSGATKLAGALTVGQILALASVSGQPIFSGDGLSGYGQLGLQDTAHTSTAPKKFLRANGSNGAFEITSADGSRVLFAVDDAGNVTVYAAISAAAGGNFGPSAFAGDGASGNGVLVLVDNVHNYAANVKRLRANGSTGAFEVVSADETRVIFSVDDVGDSVTPGNGKIDNLTARIGTVGSLSSDSNGASSSKPFTADISGNFESTDGTIVIALQGNKTNLTVGAHVKPVTGQVPTDSSGNLTITVPFAILSATGNVAVGAGKTDFDIVVIDFAQSNFPGGKVVFRALGPPTSTSGGLGIALPGVGIFYAVYPA